jgi:regulator of RNase E activity RraA
LLLITKEDERMEGIEAALLRVGTAVIADIFDSVGQVPPVLTTGLFAVPGPSVRFAGPAYTVTGESYRWSGGGDRAKLAAIDAMPPGVVPVWAGNDIRGVCCFGDLLAEAMKARGCAGVVVDGGVRDLAHVEALGLPMMVRYRTPAQAIGRWRVTGHQVPVRLRGAIEEWVTVAPGDLVVADGDGVIVVPVSLVLTLAPRAIQWADQDSRAREDIRQGGSLLKALETYGHL